MPQHQLDYASQSRLPLRSWGVLCGTFEAVAAVFVAACAIRFAYLVFRLFASIDLTYGSQGRVDRLFDAAIAVIVPFTHACALFLLCRWLRLRPGAA